MREEEKKQTSQKSTFRRILKKRWALPAIYIASAAIVLSVAIFVQNGFDSSTEKGKETAKTTEQGKQPAVEVNSKLENIMYPLTDAESAVIKKEFYDVKGSKEEREAALVSYNNIYQPNKGIDIATKDGKTFDVVASLSGIVTQVKDDSLLGNEIQVEHDNGVVTHYQSVTDVKVAVGDEVKQGQVLAKAGKSLLNQDAGTHVHFEIRKDDVAVNPIDVLDKQLSSIDTAKEKKASVQDETQTTPQDEEGIDNTTPSSENGTQENVDDTTEHSTDKTDTDNKQEDTSSKEESTDSHVEQ
ncbi:peptidoglycan DD-metalloendopeptidase family protein [Peribacillus sp. SCS-155]|uniref:peptidoglycan DD-metalloendopeptidase family protein n=1 Tax=Peribacillus sedimenti TaxID=3115297 RepID=UPI00390680A1